MLWGSLWFTDMCEQVSPLTPRFHCLSGSWAGPPWSRSPIPRDVLTALAPRPCHLFAELPAWTVSNHSLTSAPTLTPAAGTLDTTGWSLLQAPYVLKCTGERLVPGNELEMMFNLEIEQTALTRAGHSQTRILARTLFTDLFYPLVLYCPTWFVPSHDFLMPWWKKCNKLLTCRIFWHLPVESSYIISKTLFQLKI